MLYFIPLLLSPRRRSRSPTRRCSTPTSASAPGWASRSCTRTGSAKPNLALGVVVFVVSWQFIPFHSLIYQGGVRQIPRSMYEAAELDGAGRVRQFFAITLPQLKYTIIASSTLMIVGSLTFFDLIFVLTAGGPGRRHPDARARHVQARASRPTSWARPARSP